MAITTTKKVFTILHVIHLKQLIKSWKTITLPDLASSPTTSFGSSHHIPSGFVTVYIGEVRMRFLIPTRFLNLPIFVYLLSIAEEEYGFKFSGGVVLPCEVDFFKQVLKFLEKNEKKYGSLEVHEFLKLIFEVGFDSSSSSSSCKECKSSWPRFMPLMHNKS